MLDLHEIVRLMFVLYCGGLFWMALVFLIEKNEKAPSCRRPSALESPFSSSRPTC